MRLTVIAVVVILTGLLTLFSILRTPSFQELAARIAAGLLSEKLDREIFISKLRISGFFFLQIDGLQINDHHSEEMLVVDEMRLKIKNWSLKEHRIGLENLGLDSGGFYLRKYPGDSLLNLAYFVGSIEDSSTVDSITTAVWTIICDDLTITGFNFGLKNGEPDSIPGLNFADIFISDIFIDIQDISVNGDSIAAFVDHVSCREKSGLELLHFSGDAKVSSTGIRVQQAQISTGQSSLDLDLDFLYASYQSLSDFLDSVTINSTIRSSLLTLSDVGYFVPLLSVMGDPLMLTGNIQGAVSDFEAKDLRIMLGEFTQFVGSVEMKGLPDFNSTFIQLDIDRFSTTPEDIRLFDLPVKNQHNLLPEPVRRIGFTSVTGSFEGTVSDFKTRLNVNAEAGLLEIKGGFSDNNPEKVPLFNGQIEGVNIHLGSLLDNHQLGTVNLEFDFEGKVPADSAIELIMNGWLQELEFKGHRYEKIIIGGKVTGYSYLGRLMVQDTALNLDFNGLVDFNGTHPVFDFSLDLENAFLNDLNLTERGGFNNLSGRFAGSFTGMDTEAFQGEFSADSLSYLENDNTYVLNHFEISRISGPGDRHDSIKIRSDFVDVDAEADFVLVDLLSQIRDVVLGKEVEEEIMIARRQANHYIAFNFRFKNVDPVTELFLPDVTIAPGATMNGTFNSAEQYLKIKGYSEDLTVSGIHFMELSFNGKTSFNLFNLDLNVGRVILYESDDGSWFGLDNLKSSFEAGKDTIDFAFQWDNEMVYNLNQGNIEGFANINSARDIHAGIYKAEAVFNSIHWMMEDENLFTLDSTSIGLQNFKIFSGDQALIIDGKLSEQAKDTLIFGFQNWSLANFNPLLERITLQADGAVNGDFGISRDDGKISFFAGLGISDFSFNGVLFGDVELMTQWMEAEKALATHLNIYSRGTMEMPFKILGMDGFYYPLDTSRNFDFDITAHNLNISALKPFLSSFSSHIDGFASGQLTLDGTVKEPLLLGRLKLQRAEMKVDYLNVMYSFSNEVVFKKGLIQFNDLTVYDPNSNTAALTGGIEHDYFKDMRLDLEIQPDNFLAIDLDRYQNDIFYGRAFATGIVKLSGPFNNLFIDVNVKTDNNTKVYIPINYSVDVSHADFIIFTNADETDTMSDRRDPQVSGLSLNVALDVTRAADIEIFLPNNIGSIKAKGDGKLRFGVDPYGYLRLNGSYIIQSGLFIFTLEQLVSRRFDILEGSKISWTGDIYDAEVNIVARYRLRTSLEGLGISMIDPDAASQKVIVFTDIRMSGNLFNPDLTFGISFPNMQEQTRQAVYAVLDTNDLGLMNQQAISLLVLSGFSSTGTGGSNPVNPAAIVSSTLSNMLSQISNDFNIGINYVAGDQVSDEQLEVALSTQLLDDRLIIDGNIGVTGTNDHAQKTSSIVGDINIEYKLTPDGRFRVKAFNRSNELTLYNDYSPYTQGVGVFYRKEFNSLPELFKKSSPGRKRKQ